MTNSSLVKKQFNKQAVNFDDWPVTKNEKILSSLYNIFGIEENDRLLEFACGTGAFAAYAAQKTKFVQGVDVSENMIQIAIKNAEKNNLKNAEFLTSDVEKVPLESEAFDCVTSKSAFHHMKNYDKVFKEMKRCCKKGGRICIEDIIAYDDTKLDEYFEQLEIDIDISHYKTLTRQEIVKLYKDNGVKVTRLFESVSELNFMDYVNHAVQSGDARSKIFMQLNKGINDEQLSKYFAKRDYALIWKRKILTIVGQV